MRAGLSDWEKRAWEAGRREGAALARALRLGRNHSFLYRQVVRLRQPGCQMMTWLAGQTTRPQPVWLAEIEASSES